MKGDFSRKTFQEHKRYSGVLMQQGRVQVDADWNEQLAIQRYLDQTRAKDVIGACGAPKHSPGFAIRVDPCADFSIGEGHFYVEGILCVNDRTRRYTDQPDYPAPPDIRDLLRTAGANLALVYLDVFQVHVTALEDSHIQEIALGGADTATRVKTVWQVKVLPLATTDTGSPAPPHDCGCGPLPVSSGCDSVYEEWDRLLRARPPSLEARTTPHPAETPCLLPPTAGYRRLENQLYRVEIHRGSDSGPPTFKWSRDNGIVVTAIEAMEGAVLTVRDLGRDEVLGFEEGQWVELFDRRHELQGQPGVFAQILEVDLSTRQITLETSPDDKVDMTQLPRLRRWDQTGTALAEGVPVRQDEWIRLEDGVEVHFSEGEYRSGDYWLIPARTASGDIEWPRQPATGAPLPQPPAGTRHHYCRLALIGLEGETTLRLISDCRRIFSPLTEIERTESDLRLHNRYLHGTGVVCGLKVRCSDSESDVQVTEGYAIAPDGADLFVDGVKTINVVEQARDLLEHGDGDIELTLSESDQGPRFGVRRRERRSALSNILDGTLLKDVYTDCLKPLLDRLRRELTEPDETSLVGDATRRRIALMNSLFIQLEAQSGARAWLSPEEHEHLERIYDVLRGELRSSTYCRIGTLPDLPSYPGALDGLDITTVFGRSLSGQLRAAPDGSKVVAFGGHHKDHLNLFDFSAEPQLTRIASVKSPVTPARGLPIIRDVAFVADGIVVAMDVETRPDHRQTTLVKLNHDLEEIAHAIFDVNLQIVRMESAVTANGETQLFGVAPNSGLYAINPNDLRLELLGRPENAPYTRNFQVVGETKILGFRVGNREHVRVLLPNHQFDLIPPEGASGDLDDLVAFELPGGEGQSGPENGIAVLVAYKDAAGRRHLAYYSTVANEGPLHTIDLNTDGPVSLLVSDDLVFVAKAQEFSIARYLWSDPEFASPGPDLPAQIYPSAMAKVEMNNNRKLVVANRGSHTLTAYGSDVLNDHSDIRSTLMEYRSKITRSCLELGFSLVQHIKDCLCDLVLRDCKEAEPHSPVTLAHITIRKGEVKRICTMSRDEVVTLPKLGYWLSALPILPALGYLFERICCIALPEFVKEAQEQGTRVARGRTAPGTIPAQQVRTREAELRGQRMAQVKGRDAVKFHVNEWTTIDFDQIERELVGRIDLAERHIYNWVSYHLSRALDDLSTSARYDFREAPLSVGYTDLLGMSLTKARAALVAVKAEVLNSSKYSDSLDRNVFQDLLAPLFWEDQNRAQLFTTGDRVAFVAEEKQEDVGFESGPEPSPANRPLPRDPGADVRAEPLGVDPNEVERVMTREIRKITRKNREELRRRDQKIETLQNTVAQLAEKLANLEKGASGRAPGADPTSE